MGTEYNCLDAIHLFGAAVSQMMKDYYVLDKSRKQRLKDIEYLRNKKDKTGAEKSQYGNLCIKERHYQTAKKYLFTDDPGSVDYTSSLEWELEANGLEIDPQFIRDVVLHKSKGKFYQVFIQEVKNSFKKRGANYGRGKGTFN